MATSAAGIFLLILFWLINYKLKSRLQGVKFLKWLFDPKKAILERINLAVMFGAGFGLAAWLSGFLGWLNFDLFDFPLFGYLMLIGIVLYIVDWCDGPGIRTYSYGVSFAMPVLATTGSGLVATAILTVAGGINSYAASAFSTLF
jgi:hypothetical protein